MTQLMSLHSPKALPVGQVVIETNVGPLAINAGASPTLDSLTVSGTATAELLHATPVTDATLGVAWLTMDPSGTGSPNARQFTMAFNQSANTSGSPNEIYRLGYNIDGNGVRINTTSPSCMISMEQNYLSGGDHHVEMHFEGNDEDGTSYRVMSWNFNRGAVTTTTEFSVQASVASFADFTGNYIIKADATVAGNQVLFQSAFGLSIFNVGAGNSVIYNAQNNRGFLVANRNGAGACCLIYLDASNQVNIGAPLAWTEASGVVLFNNRVVMTTSGTDAVNMAVGTTDGLKIGTATTQKIGFYNSTPQAKLTVTGAKGGNAALTSLMTQLAAIGLFVDGTS